MVNTPHVFSKGDTPQIQEMIEKNGRSTPKWCFGSFSVGWRLICGVALPRLFSNHLHMKERRKDCSTMEASSSSSRCEFIDEAILFQILLRLPVSSLLRFKSVCKPWLSLIESPVFISQHTDRSNLEGNQENKLISLNNDFISVIDLQLSNHVDFKLNTDDMVTKVTLVASFNGIICLAHRLYFTGWVKDGGVVEDKTTRELKVVSLWNPATKHVKILPPSPSDIGLITSRSIYLNHYGFGFDNKTKDYRVVRVIIDEDNPFNRQAEVYSLNTDSWRVINAAVPLAIYVESTSKKPFRRNDVYYWLGCEYISENPVILSFDFSNEVFGAISLDAVFEPIPIDAVHSRDTQILASLNERLAYIHWDPDPSGSVNYCKIWILDTCGVNESWTKLYTVILEPLIWPLGFSVNGKLVLKKLAYDTEAELLLFDPSRQEFTDTPFKGTLFEVAVYKESLVSVKGANGETYSVNSKWRKSSTWELRVSQMIMAAIKQFAEILDHDASGLIIVDELKSGSTLLPR